MMDVKIVYLDDKNLTVRTSDHKTMKHTVEEMDAILEVYTDLKGKVGDGCMGIEKTDGAQWLLFPVASNKE